MTVNNTNNFLQAETPDYTQTLKQNDLLVVSTDRRLPANVYRRLVDRLQEQVPGAKVLILEAGLRYETVLRPSD